MNDLPRWRIALAIVVLGGMAGLLAVFTPIYLHNLELQNFVSGLTHSAENQGQPDDLLRTRVVDTAHRLSLPVAADDVHILRSPDGVRIDVRYFVRVDLPGYTVNLHFYPGAGSR